MKNIIIIYMKNIRSLNFLELFNEIIRYVIILLSLFTIVSYGLFTYGLINTDYSYLSTELFLSIIYVLLVLLLSNTKKGAVSPFSTYVLLILSILNTYGIYVYLFMNSGLFYIIGEGLNNFVMANIIYNLMLVSFISSLVLNISLFLDLLLLVSISIMNSMELWFWMRKIIWKHTILYLFPLIIYS